MARMPRMARTPRMAHWLADYPDPFERAPQSPPRIRSRVNLWKFAFSSVVHNASCAADGVVLVAISLQASQVAIKK